MSHSLTWDFAKVLGESKVLRSSYFFLLIVPIVAKLLSVIPDKIRFTSEGNVIEIVLNLPFSWVAFFGAAFFATIGNILYLIFCPKLIREFQDFNEFCDSNRNGKVLRNSVVELSSCTDDADLLTCVEKFDKSFDVKLDGYEAHQAIVGKAIVKPELFYSIRDVVNVSRPVRRVLCLMPFGISLGLIAFVSYENTIYVLNHV